MDSRSAVFCKLKLYDRALSDARYMIRAANQDERVSVFSLFSCPVFFFSYPISASLIFLDLWLTVFLFFIFSGLSPSWQGSSLGRKTKQSPRYLCLCSENSWRKPSKTEGEFFRRWLLASLNSSVQNLDITRDKATSTSSTAFIHSTSSQHLYWSIPRQLRTFTPNSQPGCHLNIEIRSLTWIMTVC